MGLTIADQYYLKASGSMGFFHSDWEGLCESLNYALSYEEAHAPSLCLLGKIQAEQLGNYEEGFSCFDKVIATNPDYKEVYTTYARILIWANELERAKKVVDFGLTQKNKDKAQLLWLIGYMHECKGEYKTSLTLLKEAKKETYDEYYFDFLDDEVKRIKKKRKLNAPKKLKKKKSKKKKKISSKKKKKK
ncbi:tetratricopeptide repeat protein [Dokdonia sp.]|uniref:tetratricopeptide repeat protein n=1 Tax=Dokdonia sp. TaxID=2024995 RepID=UPI0032641F60